MEDVLKELVYQMEDVVKVVFLLEDVVKELVY